MKTAKTGLSILLTTAGPIPKPAVPYRFCFVKDKILDRLNSVFFFVSKAPSRIFIIGILLYYCWLTYADDCQPLLAERCYWLFRGFGPVVTVEYLTMLMLDDFFNEQWDTMILLDLDISTI